MGNTDILNPQPPPPSIANANLEETEVTISKGGKDKNTLWCWRMRKKHEVKPLKSWGTLPEHHIVTWKEYNCDLVFSSQRMGKRIVSNCNPQNVSMTKEFVNMKSSLPLIAIMAATTTRKIHNPSTKSLSLFTFLLPSLIRSVDCGFRYEYVLGYDEGDPYYDSDSVSTFDEIIPF